MSPRTSVTPARSTARLVAATVLALLSLCAPALAQDKDKSPERGFHAGGSYAISDIETISSTSGNLSLRVPLGGLPAGRGGLSASLNLVYNSKLWDQRTLNFPSPNPEERNVLVDSPQGEGGWDYAFGYSLKMADRNLGEDGTGCDPDIQGHTQKLVLITPDGGRHDLRLDGYTDGDGYQDVFPDGTSIHRCFPNIPEPTGTLTYYTVDGTYLRLDIEHDSDNIPSGDKWVNNPWTLYLPDGGKVTGGNAPQRIHDRNNNHVEILRVMDDPDYGYHDTIYLKDQVGRSVVLEKDYAADTDAVHITGVSGVTTLTLVKWKTINVNKTYYASHPNQNHPLTKPLRVVEKITLPAQASSLFYSFDYNATATANPSHGWGEVSSVTLPSGAQASYLYAMDGANGSSVTSEAVLANRPTRKTLSYSAEYDSGSAQVTEVWTYETSYQALSNSQLSRTTGPDGGVTTEYIDVGGEVYKSEGPDGTVVERQYANNTPQGVTAPGHMNRYVRREFTSIRDAAGNLSQMAIREYTFDKNGNVTSAADYDWVGYGSIDRDGQGRPIMPNTLDPKRVSVTTYHSPTPDASDSSTINSDAYHKATSPRLKRAVKSTEMRSGFADMTALSRTEIDYDTTGNPTVQRSWASFKGGTSRALTRPLGFNGADNYVSTSAQYDSYGNVTLSTDARGTQTQITYGAVNGVPDLYPTETKAAYGTSVQRRTTRVYDFWTGAVTTAKDEDNNVSTVTSYDVFGRPTLVKAAEGKAEETRTATQYYDSLRMVVVKSDLSAAGDGKLVAAKHYDQLGRVRLVRTLEDASTQSATDETAGIKVQTRYVTVNPCAPTNTPTCLSSNQSSLGSYVVTSQPYRSTASGGGGTGEATRGWTRSKTDYRGQVVEVETLQGSALPTPWWTGGVSSGKVTTAYDAEFTTVTDQADKVRRSRVDGLGRLVRVDEPVEPGALGLNHPGGLGSTASPYQATNYLYDALGNLRKVEQGTQSRFFMYDSLGRLVRAKNPEQGAFTADTDFPALTDSTSGTSNSQWSLGYNYDAGGNLLKRKDARGVVSTYAYDALSRNTSVTYANDPNCPSSCTPSVTRRYDSATKGKGLLWQTETSGASGTLVTVNSYDALGRPLSQDQQFNTGGSWAGATIFNVQRTYDRAGNVLTQHYPSERVVTNAYDAAGRLSSFAGNLGDGSQRTYSTGIAYDEQSRKKQEQFGTQTPVYNKSLYNGRGQLAEIRVGTTANDTGWDRGAIINHYSDAYLAWGASDGDPTSLPSKNNGNLKRQDVYIPGSSVPATTQTYYYDALNRLDLVMENGTAQSPWQQDYVYDRWGNRKIDQGGTSGGVPEHLFEVDTATNRLIVPTGQTGRMDYDAAGNLVNDNYSPLSVGNITNTPSRFYDAEGRMTQALGTGVQYSYYTYDGDGRRVKRVTPNATTWQVYGMGGELLAEYATDSQRLSPQKEYGYRAGELLVTASGASRSNVALASNGATATASSTLDSDRTAAAAVNGDRKGQHWGSDPATGSGWHDSTANSYPDWLQVDFSGQKTIDEIDVFSVQDNVTSPSEPTSAMTFTQYGLSAFDVQYWTGSAWQTVQGGSVSGNSLVWKKITFPAVTTSKIRVLVSSAQASYSRVTELEAWGTAAAAQSFNAVSGYSSSQNPSGAWSYGYKTGGGSFTAYASANNQFGTGLDTWSQTGTCCPMVTKNSTSSTSTYGGGVIVQPTDLLNLHPGPSGQRSVVRWTAPAAGTYTITGRFQGLDTAGTTTDVQITHNGTSVFSNQINTYGGQASFSLTRTVTSGDTIEFTVGDGGNSYGNDSTGLAAAITEQGVAQATEVNWLVTDQLGTPRMVLDQTGSLAGVKRHDYLPFGEELTVGGRTTAQGYDVDNVRQKFTGQERDNETGLDYFLARQYSSMSGRFTSPDPILITPDRQMDPQTLNLYVYARNNPLAFTDPTGMEIIKLGRSDNEVNMDLAKIEAQLKKEGLTSEEIQNLQAQRNTLQLELEGNKIGKALLAELDKIGERNNLQLSHLSLSTTPEADISALYTGKHKLSPKADKKQRKKLNDLDNFALVATGVREDIFILRPSNLYQSILAGGANSPVGSVPYGDLTKIGGTYVMHEKYHRDVGTSERAAYGVQLKVLNRFGPGAFINKENYKVFREFLTEQSGGKKR